MIERMLPASLAGDGVCATGVHAADSNVVEMSSRMTPCRFIVASLCDLNDGDIPRWRLNGLGPI
jgi:hypothetical protein